LEETTVNSPQIVAPNHSEKEKAAVWLTLQRLENLLKVLGAAVALVLALGTPAVVFQYKGIGLPLQFITHEEVIRAGILPTIAIGVAVGLAYLALGRQTKQQNSVQRDPQRRLLALATLVVVTNLVVGWGLSNEYVLRKLHLEYERTFRASLHAGWRVRLILLASSVIFFLIGRPLVKAVQRLVRRVNSANGYQWASLGIALSYTVSLLLDWVIGKRVGIPGTFVDPFLDALAAALFGGLLFLLMLVWDLRSSSDDEGKTGIKQLAVVIVLAYFSAVLFYSVSWYSRLPHYLGGGKPVPVTIWVAKAAVADPVLLGCATANADFARCEHVYLISVDADYYILALDATPTSRGVVLPRKAVGLISGDLVGNKP
jgi:hypothetical protein